MSKLRQFWAVRLKETVDGVHIPVTGPVLLIVSGDEPGVPGMGTLQISTTVIYFPLFTKNYTTFQEETVPSCLWGKDCWQDQDTSLQLSGLSQDFRCIWWWTRSTCKRSWRPRASEWSPRNWKLIFSLDQFFLWSITFIKSGPVIYLQYLYLFIKP